MVQNFNILYRIVFYVINLDGGQSGQDSDSTSSVKHIKERDFAIAKC